MFTNAANVSGMEEIFTDAQVIGELRRKVKASSYRKAATQLGIDPATICNILKGHRGLGESVGEALGYKPVPVKPAPRKWVKK